MEIMNFGLGIGNLLMRTGCTCGCACSCGENDGQNVSSSAAINGSDAAAKTPKKQ